MYRCYYAFMENKVCFKCGVSKPRSEFYQHPMMGDGLLGKCKDCAKTDVRARYALTRESKSKYERERNKTPKRRADRMRTQRARRAKDPVKHKARCATANAVRSGKLIPTPCIHCQNPKVQAHHRDYSKPLDVVWVCFRCHREIEHGQTVVQKRYVGTSRKAKANVR